MEIQEKRTFSDQAMHLAERYQMGLPTAEYRTTFTLYDKIRFMIQPLLLLLFIVFALYTLFFVKDTPDGRILFPVLLIGDIFVLLTIALYNVLWLLYQRQRYRLRATTCLIVYEGGFLSVRGDVIDVVYWQQIQRYAKQKRYFYTQVTLSLSDGRTVYLKNIFAHFNNFTRILEKRMKERGVWIELI